MRPLYKIVFVAFFYWKYKSVKTIYFLPHTRKKVVILFFTYNKLSILSSGNLASIVRFRQSEGWVPCSSHKLISPER